MAVQEYQWNFICLLSCSDTKLKQMTLQVMSPSTNQELITSLDGFEENQLHSLHPFQII